MLLRSLELNNFGTYGGQQSVNLATASDRNIILFGGHNGAGKSTLLEAVRLCFYGHLSSRDLFARERYERYLDERIHRDPHNIIQPRLSGVSVEFEYGEHDGVHVYRVARSWERRNGGRISESFELYRNGKFVTDISTDHWQDFVRDLIPPGVSDLFFFDGERIQDLAHGTDDQQTLSEAVKNLLGADLIERLQADLGIYRSNIMKATASADDGNALRALEESITTTRLKIQVAERELAECKDLVGRIRERSVAIEAEVASCGGVFNRDRSKLEEERAKLAGVKQALEGQIRELTHGLMPFALVPKLAGALMKQLDVEATAQLNVQMRDVLKKRLREFQRRIKNLPAHGTRSHRGPNELKLLDAIGAVAQDVFTVLPVKCEQIHALSAVQKDQLKSWLTQALNDVPGRLRSVYKELEILYRREQVIERDLGRVPQEDLIRPLLEKLNECYRDSAEASAVLATKQGSVDELRRQFDEQMVACRKLSESVASHIVKRENVDRASRIQEALSEYKNVLIERKITCLQSVASEYFNLLSRKKRVHVRVAVNPITFEVTIHDSQERTIRKQELSAGEKQIYAVSMLWALAKVSGRPLPMIIDTPLARLDSEHRELLSRHYFPHASHQVLILATDTEIDRGRLALLGPSVARSYELHFIPEHNRTEIRPGYLGSAMN